MAAGLIPMTTSGGHATPAVSATPQHPAPAPLPPPPPPPPPSPYVHFMSQYHQAGLIPSGLSAAMAMAASAASVTPSPIALMAVAALTSGGSAVGGLGAEASGGKKPNVL